MDLAPDCDAIAILVGWEGGLGDYHSVLIPIPGGTLGLTLRGDVESGNQSVSARFLDTTSKRTAEIIIEWLEDADIGGICTAAAVRLEPFDPAGKLSESDRQEWELWLEPVQAQYAHYTCLELNVGDDVKNELRRVLSSDEAYVNARTALADPLNGTSLVEAFQEDEIDEMG